MDLPDIFEALIFRTEQMRLRCIVKIPECIAFYCTKFIETTCVYGAVKANFQTSHRGVIGELNAIPPLAVENERTFIVSVIKQTIMILCHTPELWIALEVFACEMDDSRLPFNIEISLNLSL